MLFRMFFLFKELEIEKSSAYHEEIIWLNFMAWAIFHLNMKSIIFSWERNNTIITSNCSITDKVFHG